MTDENFEKFYKSALDSTLWDSPPETLKVFMTLLLMGDEEGIIRATLPAIAVRARLSREIVAQALDELSSPDPYSRNPAHDGRRIEAIAGGYVVLNRTVFRDRRSKKQIDDAARQAKKRERDAERPSVMPRDVTRNHAASHRVALETETETENKGVTPSGCGAVAPTTGGIPRGSMQEVVDAWNAVVEERPGWCRCSRVPRGAVGNTLAARCRDPVWMQDYPAALAKMAALKWMKRAKLETFLRPDTVRKLMDGEWHNDESTDLFKDYHPSAGNLDYQSTAGVL